MRYIPFLVLWGIWITRNALVFEDKATPTFKVSAQVLALISHFQTPRKALTPREVGKSTD